MNLYEIAENINTIANFCGLRDVEVLQKSNLEKTYGFSCADVMILFGGSIPYGCDVVAQAMLDGVASHFMIVGGEGHTTESLRQKMKQTYPQIETNGRCEAEIMAEYIRMKYGVVPGLLERESTNCGNNVTNALELLQQANIPHERLIIIQDTTMQRRMLAGFSKHCDSQIISYAAYHNPVVIENNQLALVDKTIWGMWTMERYISLLMGEIPRLTDNIDGYGPNGKNYIAHVEIPQEVQDAYDALKEHYGDFVRIANPLYASQPNDA